jgi:RimJ/RimL family protein N-acetyltransferase
MFEFEGVRLRKVNHDDVQSLYYLKQESWFGTHNVTIINPEDQEKWYQTLDNHPHSPRQLILMAEMCYGGFGPFGVYKISVDWVNRDGYIAWDVFEYHRGKGHGKKLAKAGCAFCFQIFNLRRLSCEILEGNIASYKCADACGFKVEGIRREAVHKNGTYVNSHVMGLLKREFTLSADKDITSPSPEERKGIHLVSSRTSHSVGP